MTTLEEYLRKTFLEISWVDHSLRCHVSDDSVTFYIHPCSKAGQTVDFKVEGNTLTTINQCE